MNRKKLLRRASVAAGAATSLLTVTAAPAIAAVHVTTNAAFYGGSAEFRAEDHFHSGGSIVSWFDVRIDRGLASWNQTCDYQGYVSTTLPNGYIYEDYSSKHVGCNFYGTPAWFTFPSFGDSFNHDDWPSGTYLTGKWNDNQTGGAWKVIGELHQ